MSGPWVNLASRALGAGVVAANDESFGAKESLVVDEPARFEPGRYDHAGEIVDGWETRRRRFEPGSDWAIVRLGAPGVIHSVDVDTSFFTGNFPAHATVEACAVGGYPGPADLAARAGWRTVVPRTALGGDAHHLFAVDDPAIATHVRLVVEPDGGVARLRVLGEVVPDPRLVEGLTVDLLARALGGLALASSDDFYTRAEVLNAPGPARTMGEGWETRRRRDGGHDWVLFRLAAAGTPRLLEVDTSCFVHNATAEIAVWGFRAEPGPAALDPAARDAAALGPAAPERSARGWVPVLARTRLQPDTRHAFALEAAEEITHLRLDAYPDGGLARVRLFGSMTLRGQLRLRERWAAGPHEG